MPSTITLEGPRLDKFWDKYKAFFDHLRFRRAPEPGVAGLGDVWDGAGPSTVAAADFTTTAVGYGVLAFAAGTLFYRGMAKVRKHAPTLVSGSRRRRRRRAR